MNGDHVTTQRGTRRQEALARATLEHFGHLGLGLEATRWPLAVACTIVVLVLCCVTMATLLASLLLNPKYQLHVKNTSAMKSILLSGKA